MISSFPTCTPDVSPRRHNITGSGQMRREGRQSGQQIPVWFIHVSFLGPELYGEREPALIELVADGVFSGYRGKARGSVKLSNYGV